MVNIRWNSARGDQSTFENGFDCVGGCSVEKSRSRVDFCLEVDEEEGFSNQNSHRSVLIHDLCNASVVMPFQSLYTAASMQLRVSILQHERPDIENLKTTRIHVPMPCVASPFWCIVMLGKYT